MTKTYRLFALAAASIGMAMGISSFAATPATAQAGAKICAALDTGGQDLFTMPAGDTILFVPQGSPLMRDRSGPRTFYSPENRDRVGGARLPNGCSLVLYGQFGANWPHRVVRATGSTGVPANHIGGVKCECK